jgi:hypothetical protein
MRVLYKWEKCHILNYCDVYFVEIPKDEISGKLHELFIEHNEHNERLLENNKELLKELENGKYYRDVNHFVTNFPEFATKDCIYVLIDKNVTQAMLCSVIFPYSGQWNAYFPFRRLYDKKKEMYLTGSIPIYEIDEIKNIDEIIIERNDYEHTHIK